MSLHERLAELEQRVAKLDGQSPSVPSGPSGPTPQGALWALEGLREQTPTDAAGAVLYTGFVTLPTGEHYEWQRGHPVEEIVDQDLGGDWTDTAASLAALGHPVRLLLLHAILRGVRTAAELSGVDGVGTTGQIYHHLRQLTAAGWLRTSTRGQYGVPAERVVPLLTVLAASR